MLPGFLVVNVACLNLEKPLFNKKTLPCSSAEVFQELVKARGCLGGSTLGGRLVPHEHVALVGHTIMDPEVVNPELAGEKDVAVVKVGRRQILLEVECYHVNCIDASVGNFTTNDAQFSLPALDYSFLVPKFVGVTSGRVAVMLGLLLSKAAQVVSPDVDLIAMPRVSHLTQVSLRGRPKPKLNSVNIVRYRRRVANCWWSWLTILKFAPKNTEMQE